MAVLIGARAVQGIGGGGLALLARAVLADVASPRERGRYQPYYAATFTSAGLAGPALGGLIAEHLHWTVIFWLNVPLCLAGLVMTDRLLRRLPWHGRPHRIDLLGAGLVALAIFGTILLMSVGGRLGWTAVETLGLAGATLVCWAAFAARLMRAAEPLIPLGVLSDQVVITATLASCVGWGSFVGLLFAFPPYLQTVLGFSATDAGLAMMPMMATMAIGGALTGQVTARFDRYKTVTIAGLSLAMVGSALLALDPQPGALRFELLLLMISGGAGTMFTAGMVTIQNAVRHDQIGAATATLMFSRQLFGVITVAGFGALVLGLGQAIGLDIGAEAASLGGHADEWAGIFRRVFAFAAIGFGISLAFFLAMEARPLRGRLSVETEPAERA
jgi:MFS family permease